MDTSSFTCLTPEVKRLSTFSTMPLQNGPFLSISNSPAKLAQAGFQRAADADFSNDEVTCEYCGITYGDWEGESPLAVHRVLNEHCSFFNTPSQSANIQHHPRVVEARRQLFPCDEDETDSANDDSDNREAPGPSAAPFVSLLSPQAAVTHPFLPKVCDPDMDPSDMLFAKRRLDTFTDRTCPECKEWAEEGFIFRRQSSDVQCVFCGLFLPFEAFNPRLVHARESPHCPRVLCLDVGNISAADEDLITLKNLQRMSQKRLTSGPHIISHPQYEEDRVRLGTYEHWPFRFMADFVPNLQAAIMSSAGFFYLGCSDKVKCYSCGLVLREWKPAAVPWEQHARLMPNCLHLQQKGQHFIQQAANVQVMTKADLPAQEPGSNDGQLVTSPPGSPTLDTDAINAAVSTGRYPTKDILLGQLQAMDKNFVIVCKQRDTIHQKDTVIQEKDTVIQEKDTAIQQHVGQLDECNQVIGRNREELQRNREVIQRKDEVIQRNREVIQRKDDQLQQKDEEIEALRQQIELLRAVNRQGDQRAAAPQPAQPANPAVGDNQGNREIGDRAIRCSVCLDEVVDSMFRPCNHTTCCYNCAERCSETFCPVCRGPVSYILRAFLS